MAARGRQNLGRGPIVLSIAAGGYQLDVTAKGYRKKTTDVLRLAPGEERAVEVALEQE